MDYSYLLSQAMVKLGEGDLAGAETAFLEAVAAAEKIDPQGPRQAEALNYLAQHYQSSGQSGKAAEALQAVLAIYERFPEYGEGLVDYYLMLWSLLEQLGRPAEAQTYKEKAAILRQAQPEEGRKPWR